MSPIPLFPQPAEPNSPLLTQYTRSDGNKSDFAAIRIHHDSTPDPPSPTPAKRKSSRRLRHSVVQSPGRRSSPSPQLRRPRLLETASVLGDKNIVNMIQFKVRQAKDVQSKRPSESDIDRPLKRRRVQVDGDWDWLKHEIGDIKERITQLRMDMDVRLEGILEEVRQFNEI